MTAQHEKHADITRGDRMRLGRKENDKAGEGKDKREHNPDVTLSRPIRQVTPNGNQQSAENPGRGSEKQGLGRAIAKGLDNWKCALVVVQ